MLSCIAGRNKVNIVDNNHEDLRKWSNRNILKCPVCEDQMVFRKGKIKIPHFSHKDKRECDYGYWENESKEHFLGKELLYKWLKRQPNISDIELEKWIPETKQRPDIYFLLDGKEFVIEYQCSNMGIDKFHDRRNLYKINNINDIWIFGCGENSSFNFNKQKVIDNDYYMESKKGYYFDSLESRFIKNNSGNLFEGLVTDKENFYIDDSEIFLNNEIQKDFKLGLNKIIKVQREIDRDKRLKSLSDQRKLFIKIKEEAEIEENNKLKEPIANKALGIPTPEEAKKKREEKRKRDKRVYTDISKQLKNKNMTFYNDFWVATERCNSNRSNFVHYKDTRNKLDKYRLCYAIKRVIKNNERDVHIYIPYCKFTKTLAKGVRRFFVHSNCVFIDGNKEVFK